LSPIIHTSSGCPLAWRAESEGFGVRLFVVAAEWWAVDVDPALAGFGLELQLAREGGEPGLWGVASRTRARAVSVTNSPAWAV
jgi:hypothetical protein